MSKHLSKAFVEAEFDFYSKALSGQKEQKPRWKRCMPIVQGAMGEAVGELYCKEFFAEEAKSRALKLVEAVRAALEARLREVPWMADSTKGTALEKMNGFGVKIGYPDAWIDYSTLVVVVGDHAGNVFRARAFEHRRQMAFADAPTDKSKWEMLPQEINAYYHPNLNEIVFPAAILQPPFFDATADDAVNYGSFGAVVGHEMTHGFDDQGSQYDPLGNLKDWWDAADKEEYAKRVQVQVDQADKIEIHGKSLNGKLSCGENIADLGGLRLAYRAMKAAQKPGEEAARINGLTPTQRFFLAWAQVWRENINEEYALKKLTIDPHGPNEYRTNGPLANMPEFHEAFGIKEGEAMHIALDKRVDIW
jgi:putative endopeptidase